MEQAVGANLINKYQRRVTNYLMENVWEKSEAVSSGDASKNTEECGKIGVIRKEKIVDEPSKGVTKRLGANLIK